MCGLVEHPRQHGLKMTPLPLFQSRQMSCLEVCAESRRPKKRKSEPFNRFCLLAGGRQEWCCFLTVNIRVAAPWPPSARWGSQSLAESSGSSYPQGSRTPVLLTALKGGCSSRPPGDPQSFPAPWARDQGHSTAYLSILICATACQTRNSLGLAWWSAPKAGRASRCTTSSNQTPVHRVLASYGLTDPQLQDPPVQRSIPSPTQALLGKRTASEPHRQREGKEEALPPNWQKGGLLPVQWEGDLGAPCREGGGLVQRTQHLRSHAQAC